MANLNVSSQELDAILGELEKDLNGILADTQSKLTKAREEDGSPSPGMGSASAGGSPTGSPSASAGGSPAPEGSPGVEGAPSPGASPAPEGAPAGEPGMDAGMGAEGAPGAEGVPGAEGAPGAEGGEGLDPQALEAEYAQLPLEELKAHYLAAKAALFAAMQGGGQAGAGAPPAGPEGAAGAPPPAPPAGPSPGASAGGPPMAMSELGKTTMPSQAGNGGQKVAVAKSEVDALQAQIEALTKIVSTFVNKPMQKAITGTSYVAKSEEAPKSVPVKAEEVTAKLTTLTRSADLKKSDRDLINRFYEGTVKIDAIEHLLK